MSDRNWEAELAKIDKQLASVSDEQLLAESKPVPAGKAAPGKLTAGAASAPAAAAPQRSATTAQGRSWVAWIKVVVAVTAAGGLMFWPWPARCGAPLIGFTAATGAVAALGLWSAVGTWRHRLGLAHIASLLVTLWGAVLGAREILPRVGYAVPSIERAAQWSCEGLPVLPVTPSDSPTGLPSDLPANGAPAGAPAGGPPAAGNPA
ncbi:MAG: hypothetical protein KA154_05680 [Gemmatimonadaceae bacterium]|nr:hypothetical protein [Gemmatimonadaceae bacterium]